MMNSVCVPQTGLAQIGSLINRSLEHICESVSERGCELALLITMRARKESAHAAKDYSNCLFHLRTLSRKRRVEECRARCHWFNKVEPTFEVDMHHQYIPVAAYADELKLIGQRTTRKNERVWRQVLLEPATVKISSCQPGDFTLLPHVISYHDIV